MIGGRHAAAWACAAAIIASAPFVQEFFAYLSEQAPRALDVMGTAATTVPAGVVVLVALWKIRDRRVLRYTLGGLGLAVGATYILYTDLDFTEAFHFTEYGVLAILFYRVWIDVDDLAAVALPLLAGALVGTLDEWVQWFIPIRAGEMRDIVINVTATAGGLLVAIALHPPRRVGLALDRRSRAAVARWAGAVVVAFAVFFYSAHVGYDVHDAEIGTFRSNFTADELAGAARDRTARWRSQPPIERRRLGREDHYLTEALWHVQQRDLAWESGDIAAAWRENRILETFFAPVLETPTYVGPEGHRWPPEQRADAEARVGGKTRPMVTTGYAVPLYTWPAWF